MQRTSTYSIAMYAGDIQGLGHVRRSTAIASRLVDEIPGARVLLFTGLPSGCFFELPPGVDFIKLPAVSKHEAGSYRPRTLPMSQDQLTRLRASVIREATEVFHPDLFLVDHMPSGIAGELLPTLRALRTRPRPPGIVLGLRDVLDEPRVSRRRWQEQGVYRTINEFYDSVLIYGAEGVFDTRFQYHLDRHVTIPLSYCGYILPHPVRLASQPSRRELGLDRGELIVVTAGGGADGYPMMKLCVDAVRRLGHRDGLRVVCVTGPFMKRSERERLVEQSKDLPVRVLWCVDEELPYLAAADLVVSMAGYNTLMEAICLGKRILTIPRRGPSAEQTIRSRLFSELGMTRNVGAEAATPEGVAGLIEESLDAESPTATLPLERGLDTVVGKLRDLLNRRDATRPIVATEERFAGALRAG